MDAASPAERIEPASEEVLAQQLAQAYHTHRAVLPRGGGSQWELGEVPTRADLLLSLGRLNGIAEYAPEELVVRVQAGMALEALQSFLQVHGQWFPVEPVAVPGSSIGGLLATGASGARRLAFGTPRDLVTGMRFVLPDGRQMHNGSRVVKDVAGYDVKRLLIGSLGTLAVITEAWLRVRPLPARRQTVLLSSKDPVGPVAPLQTVAHRILASEFLPTAMEELDARAAVQVGLPGHATLAIELQGETAEVTYQRDRLAAWASKQEDTSTPLSLDLLEEEASDAFWTAFHHRLPQAPLVVRVGVALADFPLIWETVIQRKVESACVAGPGHGVLRLFATPSEEREMLALWVDFLTRLRAQTEACGGALVLEKAPAALRERVSVWGKPPASIEVMRAIKKRFDPLGLLNPGRFVGGI
ncbi:MAG: FAD-binding oxidoreductase [Firmicutes bacterium]|nr:FAD-binding oxidoreductase [Bacillota bacterium]